MSDISSLLPAGGASRGTAGPEESEQGQLMGQDTFLKLLTTQMQNQDPLSPLSNEEFVAQLAQFSSLEQLIGVGTRLDNIYMGIASVNNASVSNLLGTEVEAIGNGVNYDGENDAEIHWESAGAAATTTVNVYDEEGNLVHTETLDDLDGGDQSVTWDGSGRTRGQKVDEGIYTFEVIATDAEGNSVATEGRIVGIIDEMDYATGMPRPSVGGVAVNVADILLLRTGDAAS